GGGVWAWGPGEGVSAGSTTSPPRLNRTPRPDAAVASCMRARASPLPMLVDGTPNCTVANAIWPSREIWPGVRYGSVTEVTCAACAKGTSAASILARVPGADSGARQSLARVRVSPEACGKCSFSSVCPGSLLPGLSCAGAPNVVHKVIRQATPASQTNSVIQRCR